MININKTNFYENWFNTLNLKEKAQIKSRLERIENYEHFGDVRKLGDGLAELRWKNGWRVYFCSVGHKEILIVLGGHKNEQEKNIRKAKLYNS